MPNFITKGIVDNIIKNHPKEFSREDFVFERGSFVFVEETMFIEKAYLNIQTAIYMRESGRMI